jgi:hydroxyacylglutathione hydrolase
MSAKAIIEGFFVGPLQMRCSVVTCVSTGNTVIIDGGNEAQRLIDWINRESGEGPDESNDHHCEQQRKVIALWNTHAHFDHSGAIPSLLEEYQVDWYLHPDDNNLQSTAKLSASRWNLHVPEPAVATKIMEHGGKLECGDLSFEIRHSPGHSLGSVCLILDNCDINHAFVGDVLFAGGVGRTDIPNSGGNWPLLKQSIEEQLFTLDDETIVYPGHGPLTTIGEEKRSNPYLNDHREMFL